LAFAAVALVGAPAMNRATAIENHRVRLAFGMARSIAQAPAGHPESHQVHPSNTRNQGLTCPGRFSCNVPSVPERLHFDVSDEELARRRAAWKAPAPPKRGYYKLYVEHVQQADKGADLDFLVGGSGTTVTRDSH
jgi:hypothetical protein